jgi:hypothetical protein
VREHAFDGRHPAVEAGDGWTTSDGPIDTTTADPSAEMLNLHDIDGKVLAALLAAAASIAVSFVSILGTVTATILTARMGRTSQLALEELKDQSLHRKADRDAARDYEYEARKRLYRECEPAIFQLVEEARCALTWIEMLARLARSGTLDFVWLKNKENRLATLYRLVTPLAAFKLLRERLTVFDLSLEPRIYLQYSIGRFLLDSFAEDDALARLGTTLPYEPHGAPPAGCVADPAIYSRQGIDPALLDRLVAAFLEEAKLGEQRNIVSYARFRQMAQNKSEPMHDLVLHLDDLLLTMEPSRKPVLWRIIVLQYMLYTALTKTASQRSPPIRLESVLRFSEEICAGAKGTTQNADHAETVSAVMEFLDPRFERIIDLLSPLPHTAESDRRSDHARAGAP